MPEMFRKVEIENRKGQKIPIHIYGFAHGTGKKGSELTAEVGASLKEEAKTFRSNDYLMGEGTPNALLRYVHKLMGGKFQIKMSDNYGNDALRRHIPRIDDAEEIEHFEQIRIALVDPDDKIMKTYWRIVKNDAGEARSEELDAARKLTRIDAATAEQNKLEFVERLVQEGIDLEQAKLFTEAQTTFRSLLMADAAYHRAYATGQPVRLFVGFTHAHEIEEFLIDSAKRKAYIAQLPRALKALHDKVERHSWNVLDLFEHHASSFEAKHHIRLYKWIALEAAKQQHAQFLGGSPSGVINLADFRRMLPKT